MIIEVLYPEICNLYGDLMNVSYLEKTMPESDLIRTTLKLQPAFVSQSVDFVYIGSMTESAQELAIEALEPYRERLLALIHEGTVFLATGNAIEIFGEFIENEDESKIKGLGIFDIHAKRKMMKRYNSLFLGKFEDMEIVGFKSQFSHSYGDNSDMYLFETIRGDGLNPGVKCEGIRKNNFMATYVLGPLLILNPLFTRYLLNLLGVENIELAFEEAAMESYVLRLQEFKNPKTGISY